MAKIICIASSYPTNLKYWRGTFVENFCEVLHRSGANVEVIVPEGWQNVFAEWIWVKLGFRNCRPRNISFSYAPFISLSRLGFRFTILGRLNRYFQERAIYRKLSSLQERPDFVYAHFLGNGLSAHRWCCEHDVPLVVVSGESSYGHFYNSLTRKKAMPFLRDLHHLFFVSNKNKEAFKGFFNDGCLRTSVLPNAVDTDKFQTGDKMALRRELDLPLDVCIVAFLGYFIERKGPLRLLIAIKKLNGVYGVFIGTGSQKPSGERVLFAGTKENNEVPKWLAACDLFVLPSLHEGRSNAIIEALACGLPVVVSDRSFNREFLSEDVAVFVDPEKSDAIACGISQLMDSSETRARMSIAARELAEEFSLARRADTFLRVIECSEYSKDGISNENQKVSSRL